MQRFAREPRQGGRAEACIAAYNSDHGKTLGHTLRTIAVALAALAVLLWIVKYWSDTNSKDMGTMSRQWLAEYNASHP